MIVKLNMLSRKNNRLCIVGSAPNKSEAPYDDLSFDIWAISGAAFSGSLGQDRIPETDDNKWHSVHRVDAYFEMHKRNLFLDKLEALKVCGLPVIMQRVEPDIPTSEEYPVELIANELGEEFSSTVAFMFAYAIFMGYDEIRFYGIYLLHDTEYTRQRAGFKYYLGIARGMGISVWAPDNTYLTRPAWRYGYDDIDEICGNMELRKKSLEDQMNKQKQVVEDARQVFFQFRGAAQDCADNIDEIKRGLP
ncbi:MAG: hypothetical protein IMZ61_04695 [Planctomycetes bacterium]|nr:hypothetical protein [Planctomycetota bacterium]